ncbi:MAG: hypothetical protein NVSMB25_20530 [Thermoleophilaceae bacterium]
MAEVMNSGAPAHASLPAFGPAVEIDEAGARRQLRDQIARLETELGTLFCSAYPRQGFEWKLGSRGGPRMLSLAELERVRDELASRLQRNRSLLSDRTYTEELHRRRIEELLLAPEEHKWVRVTNADIGEPGCKSWHVVPRFGPIGILASWWHVKISSGCPLAGGRGLSAAALHL